MQLENDVKTKLGKAMQQLEEEKRLLRNFESDKRKHIDRITIESAKGIKVTKLKELTNFTQVLTEKIEWQKENINKARKNVDKYREELLKAVHARKIMEKLKEKKKEEYFKEEIKKEQLVNDEITSFKYSKKK
jgi:flagellar FliJ protein